MYGIIDGIQRGIINSVVQQGAGMSLQYMAYRARVLADSGSITNGTATSEFFRKLKEFGIYDSCKLAISPDFGIKTRVSGSNTFVSKGYSLVVPQARYGPELVVNGGFDSDTDWSKGTGWTISGGKANCSSAVTTEIYQGIGYVGKKYTVTYTVSNYVSGNITVAFGYSGSLLTNGNGTYSITGIVTSVNRIGFFNSNGFTGSIDNVSIVEVLNSLDGSPTDATQTTSTSQPHLGNIIAPNERPSFKNPNGQSNFLAHPTISFAANESWSVTTVLQSNGSDSYDDIFGKKDGGCGLRTTYDSSTTKSSTLSFVSSSAVTTNFNLLSKNIVGKIVVISLIAENESLKLYINGILKDTVSSYTNRTVAEFNAIFSGWNNVSTKSNIYAHIIHAQALTPTQVSQLANYLRSKYPEIPSVTIGSQVWATSNCEMVATPRGNLIANVTSNATWADSTNIYNTTYAATSGTDEQKTYAAVKAAAMWCYYNNDPSLGAIYGKLYNWYAVKLLQMDIDYYNTANPSTPWGWRAPTNADFNTLATTLGGVIVAGGKMKKEGEVYWNSPNTGADNSSGFSAIGGGIRNTDGSFILFGTNTALWGLNNVSGNEYESPNLAYNSSSLNVGSQTVSRGCYLRIIKQ